MKNKTENLVSNLYSRQVGLYGLETMKKIMKLNVFIYGMRGLGFEITKNIILSGPKKVTIFDPNIAKINDLTANFYLKKEDIENRKRRDESIIEKLSLLNPYVKVEIMNGNNILENIQNNLKDENSKYDVVLISEFLPKEEIIKINIICRKNNTGFIYTAELGIYGFCFVDFGDNFCVNDENGEEPLKYCIKSISKEQKGIVRIDTTAGKLRLGDNNKVIFKEIEGMTELNSCQPRTIKVLSNDSVEIGDTSKFSDYISGGIMIEVKYQKEYHFNPLEERFEIPYTEEEGIPEQIDVAKINTNEMVHLGLLALNQFYKEKKYLPELNNEEHAKELISYGKEIYKNKENLFWLNGLEEEIEDFDIILEKTLLRLSLWSRAQISPIASFLGGVSAQEIVKFTGKYNPIHQWIWFDFSETVENLDLNIDRNLKNDRYDDQIAIYGNKIQEKLSNSNIFIIGAGALGCEFLKTFSLMGISTNKEKNVTITDNDNIEISNLNRQFLFKHDDVGQSKSIIASKAVKKMNSDFNCNPMKARIGIENENIFSEEFWEKQNFIINAVDNLEARLYISEQCLLFRKTLIDSGTLGTIANSQVIVPFKTIKYAEPKKEDTEQQGIAMCTLRNFPTLITHCIEWARDNFDGYFVQIIQNLKRFCQNKQDYFQQLEKLDNFDIQIKNIEKIIKYLKLILFKNYDDCLEIAFNEYINRFNNDIIQILTDNPPDSINEDGSKFWSANKRIPIPLPFETGNELIMLYIKKYAEILSKSLSIPINYDDEYIKKKCESFNIEKFIPIKKKSIKYYNRFARTKENETIEEKKIRKRKKIEEIEARLKKQKENYEKIKEEANKIKLPDFIDISNIFNIEEFEKDNDSNGHVEFIYAASNLRATNFRIENCDIYKVKMISGKITPAISTTTAGIVGLVSLQLYTINQKDDIKFLRDCNINLTYNNYNFTSPVPCEYIKDNENSDNIRYIPEKFTIWDYLEINKSMSIKEFIEYINKNYQVSINSISCNNLNLYESNIKNNNYNEKLEEIYNKTSKFKLFENKRFLVLDILGSIEKLNVKMPKIKYIFK